MIFMCQVRKTLLYYISHTDAISMDSVTAAYRLYQRSQVSSCACINTECILEKVEQRRVERELREKIRELQLCLRLKEQKDGDAVDGKRKREEL